MNAKSGDTITIEEARRVHRQYITEQLWELGPYTPTTFLIAAGFFYRDKDNRKHVDEKLQAIFHRFLNTSGKLTGEKGKVLRDAMDRFGIDYQKSPTYPLEPLSDKASA